MVPVKTDLVSQQRLYKSTDVLTVYVWYLHCGVISKFDIVDNDLTLSLTSKKI